MELEPYVDHIGQTRKLGRLAPMRDHLLMRAGYQSFTSHLRAHGLDLIPRNLWTPIRRREIFGTKFILNQQQCGGCSGWSGANANMRMRALRGLSFQRLSGAYLYAHANHGSDNGSVITDIMSVMMQFGTCLESEMDFPNIYMGQIPPQANETAKRFRLIRALTLTNFDEIVTALIMGFFPQFPIMVGRNFERFSPGGIAGVDRGDGNHSVHADGLDFIENQWVVDVPNTWGPQWGPSHNGRCYISEAGINNCAYQDDAYVHIDDVSDPQDENSPPEMAA